MAGVIPGLFFYSSPFPFPGKFRYICSVFVASHSRRDLAFILLSWDLQSSIVSERKRSISRNAVSDLSSSSSRLNSHQCRSPQVYRSTLCCLLKDAHICHESQYRDDTRGLSSSTRRIFGGTSIFSIRSESPQEWNQPIARTISLTATLPGALAIVASIHWCAFTSSDKPADKAYSYSSQHRKSVFRQITPSSRVYVDGIRRLQRFGARTSFAASIPFAVRRCVMDTMIAPVIYEASSWCAIKSPSRTYGLNLKHLWARKQVLKISPAPMDRAYRQRYPQARPGCANRRLLLIDHRKDFSGWCRACVCRRVCLFLLH